MRPKVGIYLTNDFAKRLQRAQRQSGATKADIVNEALATQFPSPAIRSDGRGLPRRAFIPTREHRVYSLSQM